MDMSEDAPLQVDEIPSAWRQLRIAFVTETYPPEVNGVATTTAQFVEGLHRRGHDLQLVRPRQDRIDAAGTEPRFHEVLMHGLPIPRYPNLRMGVPSKRALVKLWKLRRPDVVHVATEGPLGWSALQAAQYLKLPVTSDFRTDFRAYSRHYGIGWLSRPIMGYLRKFHNQCACTLVPTELLQRELTGAGFERLRVVPRGVDTRQFSPARRSAALRQEWGVSDEDLVIGCVGRLAAEKNLGVLVDAWRAVQRVQPRARLLLVGDGPLRPALQAACPDALFAGVRRGLDLAAHYASMDVFAFPSVTETFGNVTIEALASGLPLVAFDHAAAAQLVRHGDNGCLAAVGDAAGFTAALTVLAGDPGLRHRIAHAARQTASALGWDDVVGRFEMQLAQACGMGPAAERAAPLAAMGSLA
ncbi:glycosyltransferase family 4 protein [Ideonella alba]|uniref:Glycosyltransferase family 1 protein n=1 Tax=Ideonella alba TaxID=2824118 RepID=A0A940YAX7_9BURK|nr:glycosyltransferase family 1 protein [Ideonella alba]MBQ0928955.1 glycosyltransferase family 1 protein [Ideonella alba]